MPNIVRPVEVERRLVGSVVYLKLLHAAPVWAFGNFIHAQIIVYITTNIIIIQVEFTICDLSRRKRHSGARQEFLG